MEVNLREITLNEYFFCKDNKCFKQFTIYENINCLNYIKKKNPNENLKICKLENIFQDFKIISANIIDTIEGTSLEGQHLTGKKLIVVGKVDLGLILTYSNSCENPKSTVVDLTIPFSTFLIIPKEISNTSYVDLNYLIEDLSIAYLGKGKVIISLSILMEYLNED